MNTYIPPMLTTQRSFLKNQTSVKNTLNDTESFSNFSGLRPKLDKFKIAGIGVLKKCKCALCGMKNIDLIKESITNFWSTCFFLITRKFKMT